MRKFWILFILSNLLLAIFFIDTWKTNGATSARALPIICYLENGNIQIDKYEHLASDKAFVGNHYYSDKPPFGSLIVFPFVAIAKQLGLIKPIKGSLYISGVYIIGGIICGSVPFVMILLLTMQQLVKHKANEQLIWLCLLPIYGSMFFVFSGTFFVHLLAGFFILWAYTLIKKNQYIYAGLLSSLSILTIYTTALIPFIWFFQIIYKTKQSKQAIRFALGIIPCIIGVLIYNYYITGSPVVFPYKFVAEEYTQGTVNYGFSYPKLNALWGLLFSEYRGLFIYTPILFILPALSFKQKIKINLEKVLTNHVFLPAIIFIITISAFYAWWGGWTYGPRHITEVSILLVFECIILLKDYIDKYKWLIIGLSLSGLILALLAKTTVVYGLPSDNYHPIFSLLIPNFINGHFNPNNILSMWFGLSPLVALFVWIILFVGIIIGLTKYLSTQLSKDS